jgi:penicillin-binding protein 1A
MRLLLIIGVAGLVLGTATIAGAFLYYTSDPNLPTIDRAGDYRPKVVTRVLSHDGQLIGELFEERRTVVPRERIPRLVRSAFVDAEDAQFFDHRGLNYWGMLRALLHNLRPGAHLHGASTITQQLVRTYVLKSDARTVRRKVQEMYLAMRLERYLSKDDILWIYLNQIYFGHGRHGIEEAARYYFGKSVSEVNLAEAAVLASLPKGPEEISPRKNPERAKDRQRYVLSQMLRYRHISKEEAERAAQEPIRLVKEPQPVSGLAPEFVEEVERLLQEKFGARQIPYLGLNVRTSCDLQLQRAAREALERGLRALDEREGYRRPLRHLQPAAQRAYLAQLAREVGASPGPARIIEGVVQKVLDGDGQSGAGAEVGLGQVTGWLPLLRDRHRDRYNPRELPATQRFRPGDVVRVRVAHTGKDGHVLALENGPQGALAVIDPETRYVLALVGGYGYVRGGFNRALRAKRQPGSAFKPFVYAAAFDSRRYTPATILNDSPQVYDLPGMAPWKPANAEKHEYLGPVRLRVALAKSLNTVASQLIYDLKPEPVIAAARAAGIASPLESNYSLALGTSETSPLELTNAYATFAARGRHAPPLTILQVGDDRPAAATLSQALSPDLAFVVSSVMHSVVEEGTAISARGKLGRPAAGKTGTTNAQKDAWFLGFTADLCAGVWVGYDDMRVLGEREQGARAALPIWVEVMQAGLKSRRVVPFTQPQGVVTLRIDPQSGKLAAPGAPALDEVFLLGTEPREQALAPGEADPNTFNMTP